MRNTGHSKSKSRKAATRSFSFETCERRDLLAADLVADITDNGASVEVGGEVSYTVSYGNQGNRTAVGAKVEVGVPEGTTVNAEASSEGWVCEDGKCTLEVGDLEARTNGEATLTISVSDAIPEDARQIRIRAEIQSETREFWRRNNSDSSTTPINRDYHDLKIDITDRGAKVAPGESVLYYVSYENARDNAAPDSVISVTLAEGTSFNAEGSSEGWTCEGQTCSLALGTVEGNASGEATIATTVSEEIGNVRQLVIGAEIQSSGADASARNNGDISVTPVKQDTHDLAIDLTDRGAKTSAGETVSYYATYKNRGDSTAVGTAISVEIPDGTVLDAEGSSEGWACEGNLCTLTIGDVESGSEGEAVIALTFADELPADTTNYIVKSSIAAASGIDTKSRNNSDDSWTPLRSDSHDLRVRITDNGAQVKLGESVTYAVTYQNRGDATAVGSVVSVLLPENTSFNAEGSSEGWTCEGDVCTLTVGDIDSDASGEASIAVTVNAELADDIRYIRVNANIEAASGIEKRERDNYDPSTTPIDRDYHDARVRITDNGARVAAGGTVVYDVTWSNRNGFSTAVGSTVSVTLPEATAFSAEGSSEGWTCEGDVCTLAVGDIEAGASGEAKIAVTLAEELPVGLNTVRVDAVIAAAGSDWYTGNNDDPSFTPVDRDYHDLKMDFTDRRATVSAGGSVVYYATYTNRGAFAATGSVITVELPEHMMFDAANSSDGWTCEEGVCSLAVGDVEAGGEGEVAFGVTVASELPEGQRRFRIYASIAADSGADRSTRNNRNVSHTPVVEAVVEVPNEGGEEVDTEVA